MRFDVIEGDDHFIVRFDKIVHAVSTTVLGGLREVRQIVFKRVDERFKHVDPVAYCRDVIRELGLDERCTDVFLTAVDVRRDRFIKYVEDEVNVLVAATVGLRHPSCVNTVVEEQAESTINIAVVVEADLDVAALLDLFGAVHDVKTLTSVSIGLSCGFERASGTVSDAVLAGCANGGRRIRYCRLGTKIGSLVGSLVREAIMSRCREWVNEREEFKYVTSLSIEDVIEAALKVYRESPLPNVGEHEVRELVRDYVAKLLRDPNVWCSLYAAKELDLKGGEGTIRGLSVDEYLRDSHKIVFDELLGSTLSMYINGWKGLMMYYWIERIRRGGELHEINRLPMFMDDVVSALIGGVLSRVYDRLMHGL